VLVGLSLAAAMRSATRPEVRNAAFALFVVDWALLPPTSWKHYYVVLLVPAAVLAVRVCRQSRGQRAAEWTLAALVLGQVLLFAVKPAAAPFVLYELSACVVLALVAFACIGAVALRADGPDGDARSRRG
jgi:hypothetical protein